MSLVEQARRPLERTDSGNSDAELGVIVIEARSTTPLGPRIVHANEEICRLSGYDAGSLVGSPLGLIYDRSDLSDLIDKLPIIASRPNHFFMDRALMRNGGTRSRCHWTIRSTRKGDGPGYFTLTAKTIPPAIPGAKSQTAPAKTSSIESLERDYETSRSESISLAAGGVAHDFKNALQTIKSNLELAALASPPGAKIQGFVREAQLALCDAEMLAHQMLTFTRGAGEQRCVFGLGELISRVSRLCSAGSGIRCKLYVPAELRAVEGDPTQIYQVLHNLVINARQAMPTGGTIHITAGNADLAEKNDYDMPPGRFSVISVRDRGCGIPEEALARIFEPDYTTKPDGSGFGLASCQAIVQRHGGAIKVASRVGIGTEFLVFIPSTQAKPQ